MKKYIQVGVRVLICFIVTTMFVACDSKDEPEVCSKLVSFSWDDPKHDPYEDRDLYPDKKLLIAEYSEKDKQLSITLEGMCIYARSGYKGFTTSEGNNIGIGFSVPYVDGLVESPTYKDLKWIVKVPYSGQYSVEIYYMGLCNTVFPSAQLRNGLLLTTLELELDSDFTQDFTIKMPQSMF